MDMNIYKEYEKYNTLVQYMKKIYNEGKISLYEYRYTVNNIFDATMPKDPRTIIHNSLVLAYRNPKDKLTGFHRERILEEVDNLDIPSVDKSELSRIIQRNYETN